MLHTKSYIAKKLLSQYRMFRAAGWHPNTPRHARALAYLSMCGGAVQNMQVKNIWAKHQARYWQK